MYVIAFIDRESHKLHYWEGYVDGQGWVGDILSAQRFETYEDVLNYLLKDKGMHWLGFSVVHISEVTFKILEEKGELYQKYHDPFYVLR